jgi:hypothetical protein
MYEIRTEKHSLPAYPPPDGFGQFAEACGFHPASAMGLVAIDWMMGTLEVSSLFLFSVISFFVGCALTIPCALIQRYAYRESWGAAIGKALLCGLLTAIPTPLPSLITGGMGLLGLIAMRHRRANPPNTLDMH